MGDYYTIPLELTLQSPFLLSGVGAQAYGIDVRQQRDDDGRLLMPATQVRGILRHAMEAMGAPNVDALFGTEGYNQNSARKLVFGDLTAEPLSHDLLTVTRAAINDDTGAAKDGHLLTLELPARPRQEIVFKGEAWLTANSQTEADEVAHQFKAALKLVAAIGKNKTAGYGRLTGRKAGPARLARRSKAASCTDLPDVGQPFVIAFSFAFDRPLLVGTEYPERNFMRSAEEIGGAAIKGALARQLKEAGEQVDQPPFKEALSRLRFGFARPLAGMSTVAEAFDGISSARRAPDRTLRMRVGIDKETGAAEDGILFSQSLIKPVFEGAPLRWRCLVSWPGGGGTPEQQALQVCFGTLAAGLVDIGKTGAVMQHVLLEPAPLPPAASGNIWRLELKTPALMLRTRHLNDETTLTRAIQEYWRTVSGGALALTVDERGEPGFWAKQSLRGGFAQARFPAFDRTNRRLVEPFVLMEAGSVFLLTKAGAADPAPLLSEWARMGIPAALWGDGDEAPARACPEDFADLPFLPENGFGEVAVSPVAAPGGVME